MGGVVQASLRADEYVIPREALRVVKPSCSEGQLASRVDWTARQKHELTILN